MEVIIVSKTHMSNAACIGGMAANGRYIRLLNEGGFNQPLDTPFEVRQVWEIEFVERTNRISPHIEDVIITTKRLKGILRSDHTMLQLVQRLNAPIWRGSPDILFDGLLQWTNSGSGYISENTQLPNNSVGFWIPNRDLTKRIFFDRVRYNFPNTDGWRSLPYVGFEEAVDIIPAGTLVRVSLARWWDTNGTTENRCSLQLSGWYDLPEETDSLFDEDINPDLPF
jgi:hypothetical protein